MKRTTVALLSGAAAGLVAYLVLSLALDYFAIPFVGFAAAIAAAFVSRGEPRAGRLGALCGVGGLLVLAGIGLYVWKGEHFSDRVAGVLLGFWLVFGGLGMALAVAASWAVGRKA